MARTIYSTRFILAILNTANGFTASYTVPAGKVAVLTFVQTASGTAGLVSRARIQLPPGSTLYTVIGFTAVSVDTPQQWTGRVVLNAGDVLSITNTTAGATSLTAHASGYLLTV